MRLTLHLSRSGRVAGRRAARPRLEVAERRTLLSAFTVATTADDGPGSLRWAVAAANADPDPGQSVIRFAFDGADGPRTIRLLSPLEAITRPVVIEGRTRLDAAGGPLIRIDGSSVAGGGDGLVIAGGDSVVAGLSITGFSGAGIVLRGSGGSYVETCYVGLTPGSTTASPNGTGILVLGSSGNTIGGEAAGGNVISGNRGAGVRVANVQGADADGNAIVGNLVGTDGAGAVAVGNGLDGVIVVGAGYGRIVGNVVSGNLGNGVALTARATGFALEGNVIGLKADGLSVLGNRLDGVLVDDAPSIQVGGRARSDANQISGNMGSGVRARNDSSGLTIRGNQVGTDATATLKLGNLGDGLTLGSSEVTVGGKSIDMGNVIAYNGGAWAGAGIQLIGSARLVTILSNLIYDNAGLGINMKNGPTPNHTPGEYPGPNDWANYPILNTAFTDGVLTKAEGRLTGLPSIAGGPSHSYKVQFFWTRTPDRSGFGEGERLLGETVVTTDDKGLAVFSLPIDSTSGGGFLSATATDEYGNTSEFSQAVLIQTLTDLNVTMTADPALAPQGTTVTYTSVVTNRGYLTARDVALSGAFPAGSTIVSAQSDRGDVRLGSGPSAVVSIGLLAPGQSATLTVALQPTAGFAGDLQATATATMLGPDSSPGDESALATARITPVVDVALGVAQAPASAFRGDPFTYVLTASNAGPGTATGVVLTLPIGAGASFVGATGTQGTGTLQGNRLVVDLGSLAAGATATVAVTLRADAIGTFTATARLDSAEYDSTPGNQTASLTTDLLGRAELGVRMLAPAVAAVGRDVVYGVTVTNSGPDVARNVVVRDLIPAGVSDPASSFDGGATSFANGIVTGRLDSLEPGASATLWIVVRPTDAAGATLRNAARASSDQADTDPSNDAAWADTSLRPVSDLSTTVAAVAPTVLQGQAATYRIVVTNRGRVDEPDAILSVTLPAGATLASAVSTQGSTVGVVGDVATFRLGELAAGASAVATVVVAPPATFAGPLSLSAIVRGWNVDGDPSDDAGSDVVQVLAAADLATYVDPPAVAHERTTFQYTLTAANLSPSAATGVRLVAPLPSGVEFVSAVASQGPAPAFDDGRVTALLGTVAGSSTATLTITVRPTTPAGSLLLLSGVSAGDLPDPTPANDVGRYAVAVDPAVDLMVRLRPLQDSVELGGDVTWVAEVWNSSPTTATGVVVDVPIAGCGSFVGSASTQGGVQALDGLVRATVGTIAPGGYATIAFVLRPDALGGSTLTARASTREFETSPENALSTASVSVMEPPGTIQLATASTVVAEDAGVAYIPVVRTVGARGAVSVRYATTGGTAAPGVDYQPVAGVVTFQPGQTSATIAVPILRNPHNRGDVGVGVTLLDAAGGATLGGLTTASLTIRDLDPDFTPPAVSKVRLLGDPNSIGGLAIDLSEPLRPGSALDGSTYTLLDLGPGGVYGDGDDAPIAYLPPGYDPATRTVYLTPASPMALGRSYALIVRGSGSSKLVDLAGNPLGGGVDYVGLFARGTTLAYTDSTGDAVTLHVKNGGYIDLLRSPSGDARVLRLQGAVPGLTTLSGSVSKPRGRGDGVTTIDAVEGLGNFGDVKVSLKSPPFIGKDLPTTPNRGRPAPAPPTRPAGRVVPLSRKLPRSG